MEEKEEKKNSACLW